MFLYTLTSLSAQNREVSQIRETFSQIILKAEPYMLVKGYPDTNSHLRLEFLTNSLPDQKTWTVWIKYAYADISNIIVNFKAV